MELIRPDKRAELEKMTKDIDPLQDQLASAKRQEKKLRAELEAALEADERVQIK